MDAAQAVLVVVAPVGAAIVAFAKILLDRHLRMIDGMEKRSETMASTVASEMRAEREAREQSLRLVLEAIDETKALVRQREIDDLARAVRERFDTEPDVDPPQRRRPAG